jgi:predicted permease
MTAGRTEQAGRRFLVGLQVALALALLIGSALMAKSFWRLQQTELGFAPENVLTFGLPVLSRNYPLYQDVARLHDQLLTRLRALPGVEAAEVSDIVPLTQQPSWQTDYLSAANWADQPPEGGWPSGIASFVTPGYFQAMRIPLRQGRTFRSGDWGPEAPAVILSGALARTLFGEEDPIGRRVRWAAKSGYPDYTVIGVAGDVPGESIPDGPAKLMYTPVLYPLQTDSAGDQTSPYDPRLSSYFLRTSVPPLSLVPTVRRIVRDLDPEAPIVEVRTLEQVVAGSMARTRLMMLLMLVGAGTTLLLGVIGIYGVLSYAVRQRTSELGVRLALGASPADVIRMVVRQGAFIALAGIAIGLLAAFALTRFLESLLYEVSPIDPVAYVLAAVLLFAVALAASYLPARRAGRIDPARALRAE